MSEHLHTYQKSQYEKFRRKKIKFSCFKMSLKYIFFNFAQLKLSVAYDINFAADKISCQTSVYGLITFSKGKKGQEK